MRTQQMMTPAAANKLNKQALVHELSEIAVILNLVPATKSMEARTSGVLVRMSRRLAIF